ncbi:MAG: hypothetical protein GQE15_27395 [Archangiaceae bacterium]|nr:hypothetical protein [Archangiaceae bacterium]
MSTTPEPVSQPVEALHRQNVLFIDRTGGTVFRFAYFALSQTFRVLWSDSRERTVAHVQRTNVACAVVAVDKVGQDDLLPLVVWLRQVGIPVIASCVSGDDAAALRAVGASVALCRPHGSAELRAEIMRAL